MIYRARCTVAGYAAWRQVARQALAAGLAPEAVAWSETDAPSLLATADVEDAPVVAADAVAHLRVPRRFAALATEVLAHRDPQRLGLLYRILWRLARGEAGVLDRAADPDVLRAQAMAREVRRDMHKMKAFVRFREIVADTGDDTPGYAAWFEPEHRILGLVAPFFARRFAGMRWAIASPEGSVAWDGDALHHGPGARREDVPAEDAVEPLWRTYYASIFNPARANARMMRKEMPRRYWKNLPEATLIPQLERDAARQVQAMVERAPEPARRRIPGPLPPAPAEQGLAGLRAAASACRACRLWEPATQTVFGEGPEDAEVMLIGEQPGDEEDLSGRPFVGPAGRLLDRALGELGLDRGAFYVTNAVKHFGFEQRGTRRLHRNPAAGERAACSVWLAAERMQVRPRRIVCLGAIAAEAVLGRGVRLQEERGRWFPAGDASVMLTAHPSFVLRAGPERAAAYRELVADLALLQAG
ncbi:UdgX family uracil-DNA binding protein [Coralloluteibacterium stylophorae]|uniref:Type-4 uracil-DNA glycosylase n=1 Tax=Coralloluteibacterium stylophorae TaxID=1776034 RepID=A0A8J7VRY3_9GAMM|nr:UdgX family uracil-DNA binding protein [Coralloluteibacterium stylophorae]MBS7455842.1 UdgX family uracil-DNA binding protein [Coralloluteibacterium stylophorae]